MIAVFSRTEDIKTIEEAPTFRKSCTLFQEKYTPFIQNPSMIYRFQIGTWGNSFRFFKEGVESSFRIESALVS